ncbi:acetylornithine deacetylase [Luminiphilus sp.]|nr:acetylornithine deacetylase [Luminiphilus sp.]
MPTSEQQIIHRVSALVAADSVSSPDPRWDSSNRKVIHHIAEYAEGDGWAVEIQELGSGANTKANLIASLGDCCEAGGQPSGLVLFGHTDTVPFDAGGWDSDPLTLDERDGRLYGLGSTDMKGFFAVALEAAAAFDPKEFKSPLYLLATADEESTMRGARSLTRDYLPQARAAVVGEPTDLRPMRMHKGIMMQGVKMRGRSGHSFDPDLGNNVIDALPTLLAVLSNYRDELAQKFRCELMAVPVPTLNFGCVHGGDSPNRICGELDFSFDVRMLPGLEYQDVERDLNSRLVEIAALHGIDIEMRRLVEPVPAFEQAKDSELVIACEAASGHVADAVNFATEAPFLQSLGLETIVMGPGSIDVAHQPNEYLPLDQIQPAVETLRALIRRYCL